MILFPPAKINLGLRVTGKRGDGYHNIESVFYPVPMYDVLEFNTAPRFLLTLAGRKIPGKAEQNILTRTWQFMHQCYSVPPVEVVLLKNIPLGSGLGGGSADAAFFLKGLNTFFQLQLPESTLLEMALQLGSDVPFFIHNRPALVRGRGEKILPLTFRLHGFWLVIVYPGFSFSTEKMFSELVPQKTETRLGEIVNLPVGQWSSVLQNDFEKVAFRGKPLLKQIKAGLLASGALFASLTGSGSALFGVYDKKPDTTSLYRWGEVFSYKMK